MYTYNENNINRKSLTKEQALQKLRHYCAYQERSHTEVKEKLYSFKLRKDEVEELISMLIEDDYLNEERFAKLFAGGRFRIKKWGRVKIINELKLKKVSAYNIKTAMKEIDDADYLKALSELATKKWKELKGEQYIVRQVKTRNYLLQKGYEPNLINNEIAGFLNKK